MTDTTQGEQVAAVIDGAIANAEAKVEAAQETIEALTEAAIRDKLSARIDDCDEGIDTCENRVDALENRLTSTEQMCSQLQASQAETLAKLEAMNLLILALQSPSIPQHSTEGSTNKSENRPQDPDNLLPSEEKKEGEDGQKDQKTDSDKPRRGRLI